MMELTLQIVIKNNENTIENTINSILPLNCHILVADIGCKDNTVKICNSYNLHPFKASLDGNWSKLRNNLVNQSTTQWQMLIEPWEVLIDGSNIEQLIKAKESSYYGQLINGDIITKPTRIWHKKLKFENLAFEKIKDNNEKYADYTIWERENYIDAKSKINILKKNDPLSVEPYYYEACQCLKDKKFQEFMILSEHYIFYENKESISITMMQYYQAIVNCFIKNDFEAAIRLVVMCLSKNILMAEFWCLMGDIFFQVKEFKKSKIFYENAIDLGSMRLKSDKWPMQISKYEDHPKEMIEKLNHI